MGSSWQLLPTSACLRFLTTARRPEFSSGKSSSQEGEGLARSQAVLVEAVIGASGSMELNTSRIIWRAFHVSGIWPKRLDHKDTDKLNNRILRICVPRPFRKMPRTSGGKTTSVDLRAFKSGPTIAGAHLSRRAANTRHLVRSKRRKRRAQPILRLRSASSANSEV